MSKGSRSNVEECDACGLMFGGGGACPSCGSRVSHTAEVKDNGKGVTGADLPGIDMLVDSMDEVAMVDVEIKRIGAKTSLPFSIGGSSGGETTLPFGVGSPSRGIEDDYQPAATPPAQQTPPAQTPSEVSPTVAPPAEPATPVETTTPAAPSVEQTPPEPSEAEPAPESPSTSEEMRVSIGQPPAPAEPEPSAEVVLVARVLSEDQNQEVQTEPAIQPETAATNGSQGEGFVAGGVSQDGAYSTSDGTVAGVDQDVILHQEDVVYHDFGDEAQVSEVMVDYDSLVDPAANSITFDPSTVGHGEPELLPARALAITGLGDAGLKEAAHIGFAALAEANWKKAAECFKTICGSEPTNAAALNNFGLTLLQQALLIQEERPMMNPAEEPHFEASVLALRQAAKASKGDVAVICNLATALTSCHRHEDAIKFFDVALKLNPEDTPSLNGMAVSLIALREFERATDILREASALAPDNDLIAANLRRISPMG